MFWKVFSQQPNSAIKLNQSKEKLVTSMKAKLKDETHKFYQASCRLNILSSGNVYGDLFDVDVYYHKQCYSAFTYIYQAKNIDAEIKEVEDPLIDCFSGRLN